MQSSKTLSAYTTVILVFCILSFSSAKAQKNDLEYRHGGFGLFHKRYYLNDKKISMRDVGRLLENENKEAYKVFRSAKTTTLTGVLIAIPAGVVLVIGAESYIFAGWGDVEKHPGLLIAGAAGITGVFVLVIIANNKFKKAANIYNNTSSTGKMHLNFGPTSSGGVGLTLSL
jgi:hypothetical protein